jgi:hypothetical protein
MAKMSAKMYQAHQPMSTSAIWRWRINNGEMAVKWRSNQWLMKAAIKKVINVAIAGWPAPPTCMWLKASWLAWQLNVMAQLRESISENGENMSWLGSSCSRKWRNSAGR